MKKNIKISALFSVAFVGILAWSSCLKDAIKQTYTYTYYAPVYKTKAEVKTNIKSDLPQPVENPGKIIVRGSYIFLNEVDKGVHIIDNSNPASPRNLSFIHIPGNIDLAVKGDILYADLYTDLAAINISDLQNVVLESYVEGVFPFRAYFSSGNYAMDTSKVIIEWEERDTTVTESLIGDRGGFVLMDNAGVLYNFSQSASLGNKSSASSPIGVGGSMARFTIVKNILYTVSNSDLNVFDITQAAKPFFKKMTNVGSFNVETIFPYKDKLFIGSQNGVYMYSIEDPVNPKQIGQFAHVQVCDPVIVDDVYAYVTLRSGTMCWGDANELDILKLNNFSNAELIKSYSFTNPHGLAKDGNLLFICDGVAGLKIYDASNVSKLQWIKTFEEIEPFDVIALGRMALVVAKDGLYQYDYYDRNNIRLISRISIMND